MGAGGTWYLGAKYPGYWAALAPLSGPFVHEAGYPWENIRPLPNFITEGNNTASTVASRAVHTYMVQNGFDVVYKEVAADHEGMIPLVLPDVFTFFNANPKTTAVSPRSRGASNADRRPEARFSAGNLRLTVPGGHASARVTVSLLNAAGREILRGAYPAASGTVTLNELALPRGVYHARVTTETASGSARFAVVH
jgi:hypothetical protein